MSKRSYVLIVFLLLISINLTFTDSNICLKEATVFKINPRELREYACKDYCKKCSPDNPAAVSIPGCEHCCCHERSIYEEKNRVIERLENQIKEQEKINHEKDEKIKSLEINIEDLYRNFSRKQDSTFVNKNKDELKTCKIHIYILIGFLALASLLVIVLSVLLYHCPGKVFDKMKWFHSFCRSCERSSERSGTDLEIQLQTLSLQSPQSTPLLLESSPLASASDDAATNIQIVDISSEIDDSKDENTPKIPVSASDNNPKSHIVTNNSQADTKELFSVRKTVQETEPEKTSQLYCSNSKKSEEENHPYLSDLDESLTKSINESFIANSSSRGSTPPLPECRPCAV